MSDANIELKVIQIAIVLFALLGMILFALRSGYRAYCLWLARHQQQKEELIGRGIIVSSRSLWLNLFGLLSCVGLYYGFGTE